MSQTYEQLRDSATGEAGAAWKAADHEEQSLRTLYRELREAPRYTTEHKAKQPWERYEAAKEKKVEGKAKERELLEKQARAAERSSLPFPSGEGLITNDTQKLLASQNEASRIVRKLDRLGDSSAKGPFTPDRAEVLKQVYGRGLEVSGTQGGAICRGVLSVCGELGIDANVVVDGFRNERHHESLERAQHAARLTQYISKRVPEPPFRKPGSVQWVSEAQRKKPVQAPW